VFVINNLSEHIIFLYSCDQTLFKTSNFNDLANDSDNYQSPVDKINSHPMFSHI